MRIPTNICRTYGCCLLIIICCSSVRGQTPAAVAPIPMVNPSGKPDVNTDGIARFEPISRTQTNDIVDLPQPMALPDIVACCPLNAVTLRNASAAESLKNESLPVPQNAAAAYMKNRGIQSTTFTHNTSINQFPVAVYHRPLYFEDPNLERCGAGHGLATELVSAVRFFGRAPLIPYMIGSQNPHQCVQSLGDCNVCRKYGKTAYLPKLNARGVAFETAAVLGLVFLLP